MSENKLPGEFPVRSVPLGPALPEEMQREYQRIRSVYAAAIREINSRLETLDDEFQMNHRHNPIHHNQSRVKTLPSIAKKLRSLGIPPSITAAKKELHDIAGVRVVCCYVDDIYRVANLLLSQDDISLIEEKDYIKQPKENGYRSLHLIVTVQVYFAETTKNIPVEIQIRTIAMDFWASTEHQLRYKKDKEFTEEAQRKLKHCADLMAQADEEMQQIAGEFDLEQW